MNTNTNTTTAFVAVTPEYQKYLAEPQPEQWEDSEEFLTLEEVGLEEDGARAQPVFGGENPHSNGIYSYTDWFYDGDESAFSVL